ncbi:MAG TPA: diaminopimelate epimerase [Rikenellaceae bacterium]|nr:diaminopimelate epimerase [Rikenellaceae bacterium]
MVELYKYSGAGNDFVVLDGRAGGVERYRDKRVISILCDRSKGFLAADGRVGADGLMILSDADGYDFSMEFYNPDGSSGMMCGNGGRCIVAFADFCGIRPSDGGMFRFVAADGVHTGKILSRIGDVSSVRLGMIDCTEYRPSLDGWFLNTGTRHFVKFVPDVDSLDIESVGKRYRLDETFAPQGVNANFVQILDDGSLKVRTFEKGVEAETLACGTGLTASAIASWLKKPDSKKTVSVALHARIASLEVEFCPPSCSGSPFTGVFLTGPAEIVR